MTELMIVLNNGHTFTVNAVDVAQFHEDLVSAFRADGTRSYLSSGQLFLCVNDISAIHPADWLAPASSQPSRIMI